MNLSHFLTFMDHHKYCLLLQKFVVVAGYVVFCFTMMNSSQFGNYLLITTINVQKFQGLFSLCFSNKSQNAGQNSKQTPSDLDLRAVCLGRFGRQRTFEIIEHLLYTVFKITFDFCGKMISVGK